MSLNGTVWTPVGPSPIAENSTKDNGLVTCIAINPSNQNVIYIGTAGGGVWRSRDGGNTWTPLFDRQLALGIGEPGGLAIDTNNTDVIYAGTSQRVVLGTGIGGIFSSVDSSQGIFKSTDGGNTWIQLGSGFPAGNTGNALNTFLGQQINVIIVDPGDITGQTLYLSSVSGIYRSVDGGQNWTQGNNVSGDARSLVLDTSSPFASRILYTGVTGQGAFTSADGGRNWTRILSGSTPAVAGAIVPPTTGFSKVIIAIPPPASPPNPAGVQVLYVTLSGTGGAGLSDPVGVFISTDQGATWVQQAAAGMPTNTQGGYSFHMAVDPASPGDGVNDIIYFGDVGQAKSTNSGVSFSPLTGLHPDTHAWAFFPQPSPAPSTVYIGCDGGIDTSTDGGALWKSLNIGGLQTSLFYNVDLKPDATASVTVGSLQDNELESTTTGPGLGWNGSTGGGSPGWADGWDVAYDGQIPGQVYGSSGAWSPAPCTRVFLSSDDGLTFPTQVTPWTTATDTGCYLAPVAADPSNAGFVYVSGKQNLWQSQNSGSSWRIIGTFGNTGFPEVAPSDGNNVVIAIGSQVFVTTNALAATVGPPTGVVFTNITRNLPGRNINRVRFDPVDPTAIYAVVGGLNGSAPGQSGHVFRTTVGGTSWTDISPTVGSLGEQLDLPFNAIALDGADVPTTIYVGTDLGVLRSMDLGASWSIIDDIHFPRVPVSDLALNQTAGVLVASTYGRGVFRFGTPVGPAIALNLQDNLSFGTVCSGPDYLTLTVYNVGGAALTIFNVQRLMGSADFSVLPTPATPLDIAPGDNVEFTVVYNPSVSGTTETAIVRVTSNDPAAPFVDVAATGILGTGALATAIANSGNFGNVCVDSFADQILTIDNSGSCPLSISDIISTTADFVAPGVLSYPLVVNRGASLDVVIRFQPTAFGPAGGFIEIFSSDPASPQFISVSGFAPAPKLNLIIANSGTFGKVCVGCFKDEPLILNNSGKCILSISAITSSSGDFVAPEVLSYPLTIAPGTSLPIPIRFQPSGFGLKSAVITVISDDPASPAVIKVNGDAPSGTLAVSGSTTFGGVKACCCADRTLYICNVGDCSLNITSVQFKRKSRHWRILHNPFPAKLHAGSCIPLVIRYTATEKCARCCELVIESDDPVTPTKIIELLAYTVWDDCCKDHCDDCRKGCCDKHRDGHCVQGYPCCCDDDEGPDD